MDFIKNKYINYLYRALVVVAIVILTNAIYSITKLIEKSGISPDALKIALPLALLWPTIQLIAFIICTIYVWKRKSWAYFVMGILSILIVQDSFANLKKLNLGLRASMIPALVVWFSIIMLSFVFWYHLRKKSK